ncbi:hypothetical protein [Leptospira interrogans]|nr:hypothetical protein [Leptospira interrogans]SOR60645.1 conserved hypothetical protein [Leptospira interrogans serovar Manilae]
MDPYENLEKEMNNCHSWILPKGTIIHFNEIPYYLNANTEILGNNAPKNFVPPTDEDIQRFFDAE